MQLKEFSVISSAIESGTVLKALETAIHAQAITQAIADTDSNEERKRGLPTHLVICLVIAMSLWSKASMRTVLKNLVDGLSEVWITVGQYWRVPSKSSITEARQRVGCRVMSRLFHLVVRPCATAQTPGAFLGGLRLMALDGTVFDVPDTVTNARVFGYPATRPGTVAAFPKVRLVLLIEAGTHLIVDALMCPYRIGERARAKKLLRSVQKGMLLMWDRGLDSYKMVQATLKQKCDYLGRIPKNVKFTVEKVLPDGSYLSWIAPDGKSKKKGGTKIRVRVIEYTIDTDAQGQTYRLITSLTDIECFPALLLATEYHRRWEVESTIDELKVHLLGRKTLIRSLNPREVVQEIYGWLLGHWAIRSLMFQVAESAEISPLRLSFTGTLNIVRRAVPKFQGLQIDEFPFFSPGS
ncbi:IS4 family transposase [Brasilonema octagenarum UFV-E1]|uniref:IS4 family transposase n=2 Tax=Brasilonema TaxID=383614 RepID=A0A856M675_9CYAN|nr:MULTISPECIES: IS4 family transposase [Brasilonema]NMF63863.1 IS4 family transposase [Brasilonema octagenarum UFV-OR1]QDL06673.1 IS4 family transposase [Brasilonema sennae CENA114]QDL13041.1 IS4 family transposase [Brasilonema octagenarum UFV-E1]